MASGKSRHIQRGNEKRKQNCKRETNGKVANRFVTSNKNNKQQEQQTPTYTNTRNR